MGLFENLNGTTDVMYFTQAIGANEQVYRATATNGIDFTYTGVAFVNPGVSPYGAGVSVGSQVVFDAVNSQYLLIWSGESTVGNVGYATSADGVTFANQGTVIASDASHNDLQESSFVINNGSGLLGLYTGDFLPATANAIGAFTVPAPTIATTSPASGTTNGGTSLTITGTRLTGAEGVTFGGTAATSYTVDSPTQITAIAPAHAAGAADVVVTTPTPGGIATSSGAFTYVGVVPVDARPQTQAPISKKLKTPGKTVVNKKYSRTLQGQNLKAAVTKVRIKGMSTRGDIRCYAVVKGPKRQLALRITGQCREVSIWVTYTANGTGVYKPYAKTIRFTGKR